VVSNIANEIVREHLITRRRLEREAVTDRKFVRQCLMERFVNDLSAPSTRFVQVLINDKGDGQFVIGFSDSHATFSPLFIYPAGIREGPGVQLCLGLKRTLQEWSMATLRHAPLLFSPPAWDHFLIGAAMSPHEPQDEPSFATPAPPADHRSHRLRASGLVLLLVIAFGLGVVVDRIVWTDGASVGAESSLSSQPAFATLQQTWDLIQQNYVDTKAIDDQQLIYGAARGMVDALGDTGHSTFLDPLEAKQAAASEKGEYVGIGIEIDFSTGRPIIVAAIDNSPAEKAGIESQDVILEIDGASVDGLTSSEVAAKIHGDKGTKVTLTLQHANETTSYTVTLTRTTIMIKPVTWGMLPDHIALIRVSQFSRGAADGVKAALTAANAQGAKGYVLDLRDNPGGLVDEAIGVASQFMPEGKTIYLSEGRDGAPKPVKTYGEGEGRDLPMVVLVNNGSASASEIVAGGLRDNGRAELIGEKTFGTGTVLQQYPLKGGAAVVLGVRLWLTPDGDQIWHTGITPTDVVPLEPNGKEIRPSKDPDVTTQELQESTDNQMQVAVKTVAGDISGDKAP
jgi:carboxyl-terminal processing protease